MEPLEQLKQQLDEVDTNWDLVEVLLDSRQNQVVLIVAVDVNLAWAFGHRKKRITFEHLVDFHYAADLHDPPPAHFSKMTVEIVAHEHQLREHEGHWQHGKGLYEPYLPLYRVSVQ